MIHAEYEGVKVAGVALLALDTGRVLFAQRSFDETDDPEVQETFEFPGGHLQGGETPMQGAAREFQEELGFQIPSDDVVNGWRTGAYQGFVVSVDAEFPLDEWKPTKEVQALVWASKDEAENLNLRPEVQEFDWSLLDVSGNEDTDMDDMDEEPDIPRMALIPGTVYVHGVLAPENLESGDARGFNSNALTRRPLRLPLGWQKTTANSHDQAVTVGSIDRMARMDGVIHWEGTLLDTPEADEFTGLLSHFHKYGVSIDGDQGEYDMARSKAEGATWFAGARISGAVSVSIPAFAEAYVALGPHPSMPTDDSGDVLTAGARAEFDRGPGWVTHPKETSRIHDYWTSPGQPGYAKIGWGTAGDFRRAKALIGEKIAANSPEDMRYLNQIIAQWHFDALGYWPGDHARGSKGGAETSASAGDSAWEAVLVSSATGGIVRPPIEYFTCHPEAAALTIDPPDKFGIRRAYGYAAYWGTCHTAYKHKCEEPPRSPEKIKYKDFHAGVTCLDDGRYLPTGLLTYDVGHRGANQILSETATQAHYDNLKNAWAAIRIGENDKGIWFSGVVMSHIPDEDIVRIQASGQVSGEWKGSRLQSLLTVNHPGFPVERASGAGFADVNTEGTMVASLSPGCPCCDEDATERMSALREADAQERFQKARSAWGVLSTEKGVL